MVEVIIFNLDLCLVFYIVVIEDDRNSLQSKKQVIKRIISNISQSKTKRFKQKYYLFYVYFKLYILKVNYYLCVIILVSNNYY